MKKSAIAVLALSVLFLGCGEKKESAVKHYTYRDTLSSSPKSWSPTDFELSNETTILNYTVTPLFSYYPNKERDGYEVVPELAEKEAEDVTTQYAGNELYGVPEEATEGYAWKITIRKDAVWDNGERITADDFEYSAKQLLNPEMKNYRAANLYQDSLPLANAKDYFAGSFLYEDIAKNGAYRDVPDSQMWTSLSQPIVFFGASAQNYGGEGSNAEKWQDGNEDLWKRAVEISEGHTYFKLTEELKQIYLKVSEAFGDSNSQAYKEWCFSRSEKEPTAWQDVGFIKNDDYSFTVVLSRPLTPFMFVYKSEALMLVREDLYESLKVKTGDIVKSSYNTSLEKSASYGPYKVSDFQGDKSITLSKNENWFGYHDGKHEEQYQTTSLYFQFLTDNNTIENMFLQGNLDSMALSATQMLVYGNSEYRRDTPLSYTFKISFNIDRKALEKENAPGINHSIIANINFRKAVSLSMNRQKWVETTSLSSEAGFGLLNYLYVAVPETGELYRNTPQAQKALMDFYGSNSIEDITGYDLASAKEFFQKAYDEEVAAGYLKADDKIQIDFHFVAASEGNQRRVSFMQDAINQATQGTSLEGKISIKLIVDQKYYDNMKTGSVDAALSGWGGSSFDPYGVLWCYATKDALNEYGFDPYSETVSVTLDGKSVTKTYNGWYEALCNGEYSTSSSDIKNAILSANEKGLLEHYNMIPLEYQNSSNLISQRLEPFSDHYINSLVADGGIRFLKYSMDDDEWASYCKEQNNQLKY